MGKLQYYSVKELSLTAPSLLQKKFSSEEIMKKEAFYSPLT